MFKTTVAMRRNDDQVRLQLLRGGGDFLKWFARPDVAILCPRTCSGDALDFLGQAPRNLYIGPKRGRCRDG